MPPKLLRRDIIINLVNKTERGGKENFSLNKNCLLEIILLLLLNIKLRVNASG